jgi:hypothetical protein
VESALARFAQPLLALLLRTKLGSGCALASGQITASGFLNASDTLAQQVRTTKLGLASESTDLKACC